MTEIPGRSDLRSDCSRCFALCCVGLAFQESEDFAFGKAAGEPCGHLAVDNRCTIHTALRGRGMKGCTVYDCFGAGQRVSQVMFGGVSWRDAPGTARAMFAAQPVVRQLHEMLWYLREAEALPEAAPLRAEIGWSLEETARLASLGVDDLLDLDVGSHRREVGDLLGEASLLYRAAHFTGKKNLRGADRIGTRMAGVDLRGGDLRAAYLIGADLQGADLRRADMLGADVRDADLSGADLTGALYLTQSQLNAARGDAATRIPEELGRPGHWG